MRGTDAIIFDGDDTLWQTQILYDEAKERFYDLMRGLGFSREAVKAKLADIDVENVKELGFSKHRFPRSMKETYEHFCKQHGVDIDPPILHRVAEIGYSVFQQMPRPMHRVEEVLAQLKRDYRLYLYTGGDPEVQIEKAKKLDLIKYFDAMYSPRHKSESELRHIVDEQKLDIERTWMIGNSLRSDINPALTVGLRCIWIRSMSWEYDEVELKTGEVQTVTELDEILSILLKDNDHNQE